MRPSTFSYCRFVLRLGNSVHLGHDIGQTTNFAVGAYARVLNQALGVAQQGRHAYAQIVGVSQSSTRGS
jgi:hypothetical protein